MADPTQQYEDPAAPGNPGARADENWQQHARSAPGHPHAYAADDDRTPPADDGRGFADLFRQLRDEITALFRQEVALAKTEVTEKAKTVGRQVGYIAAGGVVALLGVVFVLWFVTLVIGFMLAAAGLEAWAIILAPLITGLILLLVGGFLLMSGIEKLKSMNYTPEKTKQSLKEDKQWIQNKVS